MRIAKSFSATGVIVCLMVVGMATLLDGCAPAAPMSSTTVITRPIALVYRGPAACRGCPEAAARMMRSSPRHFDVHYVGPREDMPLTASSLIRAAVYVQPGGGDSVWAAYRALGSKGRRAIVSYVRSGGRYLGICMGGYLAGSEPGLGLLSPGDSGWYIKTTGASVTTARDAVIPILWGSRTRDMYFQDGPFLRPSGVPGERILARYTNGLVAALVRPVGAGRVGVVGPHPEAPVGWYRWSGLQGQDSDGIDADAGWALIDEVMK